MHQLQSLAIDCAIADLKAEESGLPLHKFLNPESQTRLPVSQLTIGDTPKEISLTHKEQLMLATKLLKIKVGEQNQT